MRPHLPRCAVGLLLLVVTACGGSEQPTGEAIRPTSVPSSTVATPSEAPTGTASNDEPATASGETPAPDPPPIGRAAENDPPVAGMYRYRQSGETIFGRPPREGTLRVREATLADGGLRQRQIRTVSDDQQTANTMLFTHDAVLLEEVTQRIGSGSFAQTFTCTLQPALEVVRLPAEVGGSWTGSSTCQGLEVSFEASFQRTERMSVGGTRVRTIVLGATFHSRGQGVEQRTVTTSWISLEHRLIVRSEDETTGRQGALEYSSSLTSELLDLDPA